MKTLTIYASIAVWWASGVWGAIPTPAEMRCDVIVSGRTSTGKQIDIVHVDQEQPKTLTHDPLKNSPGFSWWVSKHFALKTFLPTSAVHSLIN